jgi:hypothetical protein
MKLHPDVRRAVDQIDAAVANGDSFHDPETRDFLRVTLLCWLDELRELDEVVETADPEPDLVVTYDDQLTDVVDAVNVALEPHKLKFVDRDEDLDGAIEYTLQKIT